ncbi:MAG: zeta toxin family protein [Pseudomonadota bacterium]
MPDGDQPELIFIAGPNGAGKTTFASKFVPVFAPAHLYLNVDEVARLASPRLKPVEAARLHLQRLADAISARRNVIVESTFSGLGYLKTIRAAKAIGYTIHMHYIRLTDVEQSIDRVRQRVTSGGHDIPERDLRRRFSRSVANFEKRYRALADEWTVYESKNGTFERIKTDIG